jgi:hypothetical protein
LWISKLGGSPNPEGALRGPEGYRLARRTPTSGYTATAEQMIRIV